MRVCSNLLGGHAELQLEARDRGVEPHPLDSVGIGPDGSQDGVAVREWLDRHARVAQDLPSERVEGPHGHRPGLDAERFERRIEPRGHLLGCPLVEGDRADSARRCAGGDQPCRASDKGRRLARAGRRHAEDRAGWRGCRGALIWSKPGKAGLDVGVHRWMVAQRPSPAVIRCLGAPRFQPRSRNAR
jgi:hypothetical protein